MRYGCFWNTAVRIPVFPGSVTIGEHPVLHLVHAGIKRGTARTAWRTLRIMARELEKNGRDWVRARAEGLKDLFSGTSTPCLAKKSRPGVATSGFTSASPRNLIEEERVGLDPHGEAGVIPGPL